MNADCGVKRQTKHIILKLLVNSTILFFQRFILIYNNCLTITERHFLFDVTDYNTFEIKVHYTVIYYIILLLRREITNLNINIYVILRFWNIERNMLTFYESVQFNTI